MQDFRGFLKGIRPTPAELKFVVILFFTICWLLIVLARSYVPRDPAALEGSSLVGLAAAMQQGAISGRDFQSSYGPAAQLLAWAATTLTATGSALDAYGMITFLFCAGSAVLVGVMLLLGDRISWQQAAVFYAFSILLNLFYDVLDIRTVLLLLSAVLAYRAIASETLAQQTVWATAAGLLCFIGQLVTFELVLYIGVVVVCSLIAGAVLTRNASVLYGIEAFIATVAAANLGLAAFFKLTSSTGTLLFDYHNYAMEILRGYHNTMGVLWGLPLTQTVVLLAAVLYVLTICVISAWKSDALDAVLFASLAFAAVVWLKTAFVRSDVPQIALAFTPAVVLLSFLVTKEWGSPKGRLAWIVTAGAVVLVWPSFNASAATDLWQVVRAEVSAGAAMRRLYSNRRPLDESLQASLITPDLTDRSAIPLLAFPHDNYIGVGLRRPFFAPVLETYGASTRSLDQYYVQGLHRQKQAGLDIVYGPDRGDVTSGALQAITRTPAVFEYLYRHFELASREEHRDGHYILRAAYQPRDAAVEPLKFSIPQQSVGSGILKLNAPSACGLVRLDVRIEYSKYPSIFRPSGIEISLSNADEPVWKWTIMPLEPNETFVTYISPLNPAGFHKVFGQDPVNSVTWDKLEYRSLRADMMGAPASRIEIPALQCLDSQKFVDPLPNTQTALSPS
jgi:hypothetical protein